MQLRWVTAKDERNHLQDVVVEHKYDEFTRLAQKDWIWWFLLVVKDLFADIAT